MVKQHLLQTETLMIFQKKTGQLDWKKLAASDPDTIRETLDYEALQDNVHHITFCNIEDEMRTSNVDINFIRVFKLAQLIIEYLLYTQDQLALVIESLENKNTTWQEENEALASRLSKCQGEKEEVEAALRALKKEVRNRKRSTQQKQHQQTLHPHASKCPHCTKVFVHHSFLESHILRRHGDLQASNTIDLYAVSPGITMPTTNFVSKMAHTYPSEHQDLPSLRTQGRSSVTRSGLLAPMYGNVVEPDSPGASLAVPGHHYPSSAFPSTRERPSVLRDSGTQVEDLPTQLQGSVKNDEQVTVIQRESNRDVEAEDSRTSVQQISRLKGSEFELTEKGENEDELSQTALKAKTDEEPLRKRLEELKQELDKEKSLRVSKQDLIEDWQQAQLKKQEEDMKEIRGLLAKYFEPKHSEINNVIQEDKSSLKEQEILRKDLSELKDYLHQQLFNFENQVQLSLEKQGIQWNQKVDQAHRDLLNRVTSKLNSTYSQDEPSLKESAEEVKVHRTPSAMTSPKRQKSLPKSSLVNKEKTEDFVDAKYHADENKTKESVVPLSSQMKNKMESPSRRSVNTAAWNQEALSSPSHNSSSQSRLKHREKKLAEKVAADDKQQELKKDAEAHLDNKLVQMLGAQVTGLSESSLKRKREELKNRRQLSEQKYKGFKAIREKCARILKGKLKETANSYPQGSPITWQERTYTNLSPPSKEHFQKTLHSKAHNVSPKHSKQGSLEPRVKPPGRTSGSIMRPANSESTLQASPKVKSIKKLTFQLHRSSSEEEDDDEDVLSEDYSAITTLKQKSVSSSNNKTPMKMESSKVPKDDSLNKRNRENDQIQIQHDVEEDSDEDGEEEDDDDEEEDESDDQDLENSSTDLDAVTHVSFQEEYTQPVKVRPPTAQKIAALAASIESQLASRRKPTRAAGLVDVMGTPAQEPGSKMYGDDLSLSSVEDVQMNRTWDKSEISKSNVERRFSWEAR